MSRTTTTVTKTDNTRTSSVIRDLLKELISTCSIDDAIERDALLRTMTKTLETLSTLIKNVTVPQIKEKHRSLNLKNLKLQNALSLRNQNVRAKVIKLLNLIGYCKKNDDDDENQLLIYCHQHSLSKIWLLEISLVNSPRMSVRSANINHHLSCTEYKEKARHCLPSI